MPPRRRSHLRTMVIGPSGVDATSATQPVADNGGGAPLVPPAALAPRPAATSSPDVRPTPYSRTAADIVRRPDMPVVRNVRRGSAAEALQAFRELGAEALVEELLADRIAKSGVASAASLLNTWRHFHVTVFAAEQPEVPVFPVTPRRMVILGSLFKRGGYRSFANYVSAVRAAHIEANHEWDQLLQHTATWVARAVLRGIGPARQSCTSTSQSCGISVVARIR